MKLGSLIYLGIAVICEVIATSSLKNSNSFKNLVPSLIVIVGYAGAFYFMSLSLHTIPIGIVYAIWSGAGTILLTIIGIIFFKQEINLTIILGIILTICGFVLLNIGTHH